MDQQWNWRENQALSRRLKDAKLRTPNACVEEIDYRTVRGLDKSVIRSLTQQSLGSGRTRIFSSWGPTGVGKSFVPCALAQKACRDGYSALYTRAQSLFRDLAMARADGSLRSGSRSFRKRTCEFLASGSSVGILSGTVFGGHVDKSVSVWRPWKRLV